MLILPLQGQQVAQHDGPHDRTICASTVDERRARAIAGYIVPTDSLPSGQREDRQPGPIRADFLVEGQQNLLKATNKLVLEVCSIVYSLAQAAAVSTSKG
jgi:hypothetical protein